MSGVTVQGCLCVECDCVHQIPLSLLEKAIRQSTRIPPFGLSQSRSVPSHVVPSCSWLESLRASRPSLTSTRLIVASRMANRHRSAERLTRASGARKWMRKTTENNAKEIIILRAPEARVKHLAERWRLATNPTSGRMRAKGERHEVTQAVSTTERRAKKRDAIG